MDKCQKGYICFNREIFLIVGVIIIGLAIYGFNNRDNLYIRRTSNNEDLQLKEGLSFGYDKNSNQTISQNPSQNPCQNPCQNPNQNPYQNTCQNTCRIRVR